MTASSDRFLPEHDTTYPGCYHVCPTCSGVGRRRNYSEAEKAAIVEEALSADNVSAVARKYGIAVRLLFAWQQRYVSAKGMSPERHFRYRGKQVTVKPALRNSPCDKCWQVVKRGDLAAYVDAKLGARFFHFACIEDKLMADGG